MQSEGFDGDAALDESIKGLEIALKRARKKDADGEETAEEPSFPLLEVPDNEVGNFKLHPVILLTRLHT